LKLRLFNTSKILIGNEKFLTPGCIFLQWVKSTLISPSRASLTWSTFSHQNKIYNASDKYFFNR